MARLLEGSASPIDWSVQFLDASADDVLDAIREARADQKVKISKPRPYPDALQALLPFESPWTRELVMSCGAWTAYLNNSSTGGDPTAIGPALSRRLDVRCVVAEHTPRYGPAMKPRGFGFLAQAGNPHDVRANAVSRRYGWPLGVARRRTTRRWSHDRQPGWSDEWQNQAQASFRLVARDMLSAPVALLIVGYYTLK